MLDTTKIAKRRWSPEDDAQLAEMRAQGRTDREIGVALDRTCDAVTSHRAWLREMAATAPQPVAQEEPIDTTRDSHRGLPWTAEDDAKLADLRQGEHPDEIIGLMLGRTTAAVQARISVLKARGRGDAIPSHKRASQWTPERVAEARALRAEGLTTHQIARRFGADAATVGRALRSPEDSPGEGVRVGRTFPDLGRAESDVEQARAALARAEARHREAMEPILVAMRDAIHRAGLVPGPEEDDSDDGWPEPARVVVDLLRRHGIDLRVRT